MTNILPSINIVPKIAVRLPKNRKIYKMFLDCHNSGMELNEHPSILSEMRKIMYGEISLFCSMSK